MMRDLDGTIRFWSEGCERLFGCTAEQAAGRRRTSCCKRCFRFPGRDQRRIAAQQSWTGELRHRTGTAWK